MRFVLVLLVVAGCVRRVCGALAPEDLVTFHESHDLSVSANPTSVEGLAVEATWQVCIEDGRAKIQNHVTEGEVERWGDGGRWPELWNKN